MSNAALAFLAGLGSGYLQAGEKKEKKARQDRIDAREDEEYEARRAERQRQQREREALAEAGKTVDVNQNAAVTDVSGKPVVYEDAGVANSDLRQARSLMEKAPPENAPPGAGPGIVPSTQPAITVGGKVMPDAQAAQAAAAAANTPTARASRVAAAMYGMGRPEDGMRVEQTATAMENAQADRARKLREEGVFDALRAFRGGDAAAMKEAFNKSGQFKIDGDVKLVPEVREIQGVGKVTTYTASFDAVGPDGTKVPKTFNSHDLSLQLMPYEKSLELGMKGNKEAREGKKDDSIIEENQARAGYYRAASGAQDAKAAGGAGKPVKLDEDAKLRLTEASTGVRDAQKAVTEAMSKLMPGEDPAKAPGVAYAQNILRQAKLNHLRTNIELGQIPASSMVTQILGVAKNPQEVMRSLSELATVGGTDYADEVAAGIQASDAWKRMNPQPAAKPPGKPAAAQGVQPGGPAAARPAAPATPADPAGQRLDQAREVVRRLQASAPGLAKGRQAIEEHAAAVEAARAELAEAEAAYQRQVQGQTKAYFGGPRRPAAASGMASAQ